MAKRRLTARGLRAPRSGGAGYAYTPTAALPVPPPGYAFQVEIVNESYYLTEIIDGVRYYLVEPA